MIADGVEIYNSGVVTGTTVKKIDVSVAGKNTLQLIVDPNGSNNSDHGDWAGAKLTRKAASSGQPQPTGADSNPFRYCGEYFDSETNTYYLRARYYNPATGRFIGEDPIRSGLNWYTYAANNPIMFIDPLGLKTEIIIYPSLTEGNQWYGHAEISIDGTIYAFGQYAEDGKGTIVKTDTYFYLAQRNATKEINVYSLSLTAEEEKRIVFYYETKISMSSVYDDRSTENYKKILYTPQEKTGYSKYENFTNNCVTVMLDALFYGINYDYSRMMYYDPNLHGYALAINTTEFNPITLNISLNAAYKYKSKFIANKKVYKAGDSMNYQKILSQTAVK